MVLTATTVAIVSAVGLASCVALNTAQDIYTLGKIYEGYVNEKDKEDEGYAEKIENLFNTGVKVVGEKVEVSNELLNEIYNFYENVFNTESPKVYYIPSDFPLYRYITDDDLANKIGYYFTEIYGDTSSKYIEVLGLAGTSGYYGLQIGLSRGDGTSEGTTAIIGLFYKNSGTETNTPKAYGWDVGANDIGRYIYIFCEYLDGTIKVDSDKLYISNVLTWTGGKEFEYDGTYDWNDSLPNVNDEDYDKEGTTGIYVPSNLGDLVGEVNPNDVITGNGSFTGTVDGVISLPVDGVDSTFDIPTEGTIELDKVTDIPVEGEIDIPTDFPLIPTIPPVDIPIIPTSPTPPTINDGTSSELPNDNWGNNPTDVSGGLYYYYIGDDTGDTKNDDVIGHATGVVSLSYTPYLWYSDCNISKIPYDIERFNNVTKINNFNVYRINKVVNPVKKVGGFKAFANDFTVNIGEGQPYNYKNETKLYQYPYSFAYLYDSINNPLEIKYHYLRYYYNDVYIKQTVSDKCTYSMFVLGYKGDIEGNLESMVLTSGNELPCSSSTYAQWFATNRNQLAQNIQNIQNTNAIQNHGLEQQGQFNQTNATINGIGNLIGAIGSILSLDFGNAVGNVQNSILSVNNLKSQQASINNQIALNKQSEQNAIQSALALNSDMRNSPATLISHGSNVFYGLLNNNKKLLLVRMGLNEEDYYRLGTYFTMYGYKQNKVLNINLRSRKYFNYFKIINPNIVAQQVPQAHLNKIKDIFKEGITLWHYNNRDKILDYFTVDNYEV